MPDSSQARPNQVISAVSLMVINIFLANTLRTLSVATGILSGRIAGEDVIYKSIDEFVIWGCSFGLLALIWFGINWARWLNLALSVLNIALMLFLAATALRDGRYAAMILPLIYMPIEATALYLLFLSAGKVWFEQKEPTVAA